MERRISLIFALVGVCLIVISAVTLQSAEILQGSINNSNSNNKNKGNATILNELHQVLEKIEYAEKRLNQTEQRLQQVADKLYNLSPSTTPLIPCGELMSRAGSPYADGSFITRYTTPHAWSPRMDGSRAFDLTSICSLKRYTAPEARQCLAGKHLSMVGDSLSRYQFFSLAHFIDRGSYPPRFPRPGYPKPDPKKECLHVDEKGQSHCSNSSEPNICMEGDWWRKYGQDSWYEFYSNVGGGGAATAAASGDRGLFEGRMECDCARDISGSGKRQPAVGFENKLYASPILNDQGERAVLSNFQEIGWGAVRDPLQGFGFTGCAFHGTCQLTHKQQEDYIAQGNLDNFTWQQSFEKAIQPGEGNGTLRSILPPVDFGIYNRGLWGQLDAEQAGRIFPLLYDWAGNGTGRCFYKATTGGDTQYHARHEHEVNTIQGLALSAGCSFLDYGHITRDFASLPFQLPYPPTQEGGNLSSTQERLGIYWDKVHFYPWVYEELNNVLLNVLCNWKGSSSRTT